MNSKPIGITRYSILVVLIAAAAVAGFAVPSLRERLVRLGRPAAPEVSSNDAGDHDDHAGHDHDGRNDVNSIEISRQAQANIGLKLGRVELTTFDRTIAIPGMLRERPGRSVVDVTAPLTGIVTRIYPIEGEAVRPGQKLFDLRLTHEELVQSQGEFLRVAEELDVIEREIKRLEKIGVEGGIAGRQVLERQYEQQNKQAVLRAQRQGLLVHGLSETQVGDILTKRTLLQSLTVTAPDEPVLNEENRPSTQINYVIRSLNVDRGQSVNAGDTLAVLCDHAELFIEASAFDKDVTSVNRAVENGWLVQAVLETDDETPQVLSGLKIMYVSGTVDPESRTFHFYARLPNVLLGDQNDDDGHRFINWRFKPGQRVQLSVPVEQWADRIVLPTQAIAQDGIETYVFTPNGDRFDRRAVHVEYRDRFSAVVANDGSLFPGDSVVLIGAQQMHLAIKNRSGGAIDPHAGHSH